MSGEGFPVAMNRDTAEGSSTWVCGYINLVDGPGSEDKIYDFINTWLAPASAQKFVTSRGYGHSNLSGIKARRLRLWPVQVLTTWTPIVTTRCNNLLCHMACVRKWLWNLKKLRLASRTGSVIGGAAYLLLLLRFQQH